MLKIRRPLGRLIFNMGIAIPGKTVCLIETAPRCLSSLRKDFNSLRPRQNKCHFADDTFKRIFLNENVRISIKISLKFVAKGPINDIPALVQIMAWRRSGGKPLSEPMMVSLLTHICVTRPQWVNCLYHFRGGQIDINAKMNFYVFKANLYMKYSYQGDYSLLLSE